MENIIAHLEAAKKHVSTGVSALGGSGEAGPKTDPALGPNSDLPHYNATTQPVPEQTVGPNTDLPHYSPDGPVAPEQTVGPNTDLPHYDPESLITDTGNTTSDDLGPTDGSGIDHTIKEHEIDSFGDEGEDEPLLDSVEVYEYDLGQYGDSVSSVDLSSIPGDAELNFLGYDASGAAIVSIGKDGVVVAVEGEAAAYLAQYNHSGQAGPLGVSVEALIGASAEGSAELKINPFEGDLKVEVQAGVVVGATIDANGELELGHVTIEGGATGVAGFAAEVELDVGFDDWEFEFDAGGKLAFLLGGGVDVSFAVDGKEIVADLGDAGKVVWNESGEIVGGIIDTGGEVVEFAADGFEWVGGGLQTVGGGIKDGIDYIKPWDGWFPG